MHVPCCFVLWYLLCKSNLLFILLIHFSQVTVFFWWWWPLEMLWWRCYPPELLLVLLASVSLYSTCRIHYGLLPLPSSIGTSPTTLCSPSYGLYFSLSYSFLELLRVCLHRNEVRFCLLHCCDVKVVVYGDDKCSNIYVFLLVWIPEQEWCYIPCLLLIGMPWLVCFSRHLSWLIWI
jgi:hypothetical protein